MVQLMLKKTLLRPQVLGVHLVAILRLASPVLAVLLEVAILTGSVL
jgi:hypothetical protein